MTDVELLPHTPTFAGFAQSGDINSPDYRPNKVREQDEELEVARDVEAGWKQIRAKGTRYLPRHPKETGENYDIRAQRPAFFNSYARTTGGLTGMVFRRNPVLQDDVPDPTRTHWENIDSAGTHGDVFAKELCHDILVAGHGGILVDFPTVDGMLTRLQEREMGVRPYWSRIRKEDIFSWRVQEVFGRLMLSQLVLREIVEEDDGDFGVSTVDRFRVFRRAAIGPDPVTFELWEKPKGQEKARLIREEMPIRGVQEIPFVPVYANKTAFLQSKPPLIDLAYLAIRYYQTNSDMLHAAHIANVPVPVIRGFDPQEELALGPNTAVKIPDPSGDFHWAETSGAAIGQTKGLLDDMRTEMAVLGLGILERRPIVAETATAKRIDRSEKDSQLSSAARSLEDGIERAMGFHAQFLGIAEADGSGGSITLNKDFLELTLTPEQIQVYVQAVTDKTLSLETLWSILQEGNALPANFDPGQERQRIAAMAVVPEPAPEPQPMP